MQLSRLSLKNYVVTNLSFRAADPQFSSPEEADAFLRESTANITTKVELSRGSSASGEVSIWKVSLHVSCVPAPGTKFGPYTVELELVGFFELPKDFDADKAPQFVSANGASALYGVARELIVTITGKGPYPPVLLPLATFAPTVKPAEQPSQEQTLLESKASP